MMRLGVFALLLTFQRPLTLASAIDDVSCTISVQDQTDPVPSQPDTIFIVGGVEGCDYGEHEVIVSILRGRLHLDAVTSTLPDEEHMPKTPSSKFNEQLPSPLVINLPSNHKRDALPACLNARKESSCYNLATNCIDSIGNHTRNDIWSIDSCAVAGTCYGVGELVKSVNCQTGFTTTALAQSHLAHSIFDDLAGNCSSHRSRCSATQKDYVDWYYGMLSEVGTAAWPKSTDFVVGYWDVVIAWSNNGSTLSYKKLDEWLHHNPSESAVAVVGIKHHALPLGTILAIVFGCILAFGFAAALMVFRHRRSQGQPPTFVPEYTQHPPPTVPPAFRVTTPMFGCDICLVPHREGDVVKLDPCGHAFCKDCLKSHICSKLADRQIPRICPSCMTDSSIQEPGTISSDLAQQVKLSEDDYKLWSRLEFEFEYVHVQCPGCEYDFFVDRGKYGGRTILSCPRSECPHLWCKFCEYALPTINAQHSCDGLTERDELVRSNGWQYCPCCRAVVEKKDALDCNHIKCSICKVHFCYRCGDFIIRSDLTTEILHAVSNHYKNCEQWD